MECRTFGGNERIAAAAKKASKSIKEGYASGTIIDWHVLDPAKAVQAAKKSSATKLAKFASGESKAWNLNKTKASHPSIAAAAAKISARYRLPAAGRRVKLDDLEQRIKKHEDKFVLLSDLGDYVTRRVERLLFRCVTCQRETTKSLAMLENTPVCFACHPKESKGQLEVFDFVRSLAPDAVLSDRAALNGLELDVFVPSRRFGIEYDGLYYHSEECTSGDRATDKMRRADDSGVSLLRIFEDEWRDKRAIVESMIRHRLGQATSRVGARQCELRVLSPPERREFMEQYHLDGDARCKVAWGLVRDGKIMSALSVRRPFHRSNAGCLEIARFCVAPGTSVPGALARLAKRALLWSKNNGHDRLMTYVDRRVGLAKGYLAAGFKVTKETKPRFWWTDFTNRYDRFSVRADAKNGITQQQAASTAGVVKIWGCPNLVLELC